MSRRYLGRRLSAVADVADTHVQEGAIHGILHDQPGQ
jgi:hypothetical protein